MLVSQFSLITFVSLFATSTENNLDTSNLSQRLRKNARVLNLNETYFSSLENYQVNAARVTKGEYPWIARVVHSRSSNVPHVCTAVCVDEAIFITASRCIFTLKVNYTTVIYRSKRFEALAFVVPSKPTKQAYNDIGFIVVESRNHQGRWAVAKLRDRMNKIDGPINYTVVGYATKKGIHKIKAAERQYNLTKLSVVASLDLCPRILEQYRKLKSFYVPCYHSCTVQQFMKNNKKCNNYHGVEGGAVFDPLSNKLIGIATWGCYFFKYELPVGYAVVNSVNFINDFKCARRIREDNGLLITKGYYQSLCDRM